jgi:hypothetical protein
MNNEHDSKESEVSQKEVADDKPETVSGDGEFKVTVRKLEMPVKPRGVLADG